MPAKENTAYKDKDSPDNLERDYEIKFVTKLSLLKIPSIHLDITFARMNLKGCHESTNSYQECHGTDEKKFPRHDFCPFSGSGIRVIQSESVVCVMRHLTPHSLASHSDVIIGGRKGLLSRHAGRHKAQCRA